MLFESFLINTLSVIHFVATFTMWNIKFFIYISSDKSKYTPWFLLNGLPNSQSLYYYWENKSIAFFFRETMILPETTDTGNVKSWSLSMSNLTVSTGTGNFTRFVFVTVSYILIIIIVFFPHYWMGFYLLLNLEIYYVPVLYICLDVLLLLYAIKWIFFS